MAKFKPGIGGCATTRWQKGTSGNPSGVPRGFTEFKQKFAEALAGQGSAEELAEMIWKHARKGEPWALIRLAEYFEIPKEQPESGDLKVVVEYVQRNQTLIVEPASSAAAGDTGSAAHERRLLRPALGQDDARA